MPDIYLSISPPLKNKAGTPAPSVAPSTDAQTFSTSDIEQTPQTFSISDIDQTEPPPPDKEGFVKSYWNQVNPIAAVTSMMHVLGEVGGAVKHDPRLLVDPKDIAETLIGAAQDPTTSLGGLLKAHEDLWQSAQQDIDAGNYADAGVKRFNAMIPLFGLVMQHAAEQGAAGDYPGLLGTTAGMVTNLKMPAILKKVRAAIPGSPTMNAAPDVQQAIRTGQRYGVPIDAATATGNPVVAYAQKFADTSLGGAIPGQRALSAQEAALDQMGTTLAKEAHPVSVSPEMAGEGAVKATNRALAQRAATERNAYGDLEAIEKQNPQTVQTGTQPVETGSHTTGIRTQPVMETMGLPTRMSGVKAALRPLLKPFQSISLVQRQASPMLQVIEQILNGPEYLPASEADRMLSAVKAAMRAKGEIPQLRGAAGWLGSKVIQALSPAIDEAVAQGGPAATDALALGRAATKAKFQVGKLLDTLTASEEGVGAFERVTRPMDRSVGLLRQLAKVAPDAPPALGRAVLDRIINGTKGWRGQFNAWENLGPQTKAILFPDATLRAAIGDYFRLGKALEEAGNINPSRTALGQSLLAQGSSIAMNPVAGIGASVVGGYSLSKLFHSAAGVRLLTEGLRIPAGSAAATGWLTRVAAKLRQAVPNVPTVPLPVAAQNTTPGSTP